MTPATALLTIALTALITTLVLIRRNFHQVGWHLTRDRFILFRKHKIITVIDLGHIPRAAKIRRMPP